ncbi:hypothetical protein [Devosia sp.]|uniref:hypothetical protein n=1 Tax=Devosia sp. TaxID=1871048 RepID=UPI003BA8F4A3
MVGRILLGTAAIVVLFVGWGVWMLLGGLVPGGGTIDQNSVTKRYKIEMTFDVAGKTVTGSGVFIGRFTAQTNSLKKVRYAFVEQYFDAEGIVIDLPDGSVLASTVRTTTQMGSLNSLFLDSCRLPRTFSDKSGDAWLAKIEAFQGQCELEKSLLPALVLFPDRTVPKGIYIDPSDNVHDIRFVSGSVSTTTDDVLHRITTVLPWTTDPRPNLEIDYGKSPLDPRAEIQVAQFNWRLVGGSPTSR